MHSKRIIIHLTSKSGLLTFYLEKSISTLSLGCGIWKAKTMLSALSFCLAASSPEKLSIRLHGFGPRGVNQMSLPSLRSCNVIKSNKYVSYRNINPFKWAGFVDAKSKWTVDESYVCVCCIKNCDLWIMVPQVIQSLSNVSQSLCLTVV